MLSVHHVKVILMILIPQLCCQRGTGEKKTPPPQKKKKERKKRKKKTEEIREAKIKPSQEAEFQKALRQTSFFTCFSATLETCKCVCEKEWTLMEGPCWREAGNKPTEVTVGLCHCKDYMTCITLCSQCNIFSSASKVLSKQA